MIIAMATFNGHSHPRNRVPADRASQRDYVWELLLLDRQYFLAQLTVEEYHAAVAGILNALRCSSR
jgi:hypothetical protein